MGLKEKMAESWMGNMDSKEKREMMDSMMDRFFESMSAEERTKTMEAMMEKFMGRLKPEEMQAMFSAMMPKMMGGVMAGKESPMGGMMGMMMGKSGQMKEMMSKMMDGCGEEGKSPWDMCRKVMSSIGKTADLATFATPEVRGLFEEWAAQIEEEILHFIKESKTTDADQIAARFKLSKNSANYFLARLSQQGKISLKAEHAAG